MILTLEENGFEEDYLKDTPVHHFDDCLTFEECMMLTIEEADKTWNDIMQGIGVAEVRELAESGEVMIYEEGKISGIVDKFKAWAGKVWAQISGMFEKFMKWIREKLSGDKRFIKKYKEKILKATVPADGIDIGGKWYTFAGLTSNSVVNGVVFAGTKAIGMDEEAKKETIDTVCDKIVSGSDKSSFAKKLKEHLLGEEKTGNVTSSFINKAKIVEDIEKSQETMNNVRTQFKNAKKNVNNIIAEAKKLKKENKDKDYAKSVSIYISYLKDIIKIETNIRSASLSAWKLYNKQNKAIGKKLAALGGAEKKEEKTNESYQFDDNLDDFFSTSFC